MLILRDGKDPADATKSQIPPSPENWPPQLGIGDQMGTPMTLAMLRVVPVALLPKAWIETV